MWIWENTYKKSSYVDVMTDNDDNDNDDDCIVRELSLIQVSNILTVSR